jgi:hypothetical protein
MTCQGLSFDREHETITLSFGIFRKTKGSSRRHPDLDIIASYKNSTESYLPLKNTINSNSVFRHYTCSIHQTAGKNGRVMRTCCIVAPVAGSFEGHSVM